MTFSKTSVLDGGVFLAAATAFLYCASTAHFHGYLRPLQLDSDVLDRNFHQVLYTGLLISFVPSVITLLFYGVARFLYSHVLLPSLRESFALLRRFTRLKRKLLGKRRRKGSPLEREQKQHTMQVLAYVGVATAFIIALAFFETRGEKEANKTLARLNNNSTFVPEIVRVKVDDEAKSLFYLTCGARNCAAIDATTKVVYYFPQNGHSYHYVTLPPTATAKASAPPASASSAGRLP